MKCAMGENNISGEHWFIERMNMAEGRQGKAVRLAPAIYIMTWEGSEYLLINASISGQGRKWIAVEVITGTVQFESEFKRDLIGEIQDAK